MPVIDLTNLFITIPCLIIASIMIYFGYRMKRSVIPAIALIVFICFLIIHAMQLFIFKEEYLQYEHVLAVSMIYDFIFVLVTYLAYLWTDDIEAKYRNKKSIDNSLDWFWNKVI